MPVSILREFLKLEAAGGIILIFVTVVALIVANSPFDALYGLFLNIPVAIKIGTLEIAKPLILWINDGMMAVFFFLVGLEIKREFLKGELSSPSQLALPALAAVGGMVVPGAVYAFVNWDNPENLSGWAIPTATDIAFALGIMALLGSRVPLSLKVLLTTIAIIDDLGAIVIIALVYTADLSFMPIAFAGAAILGLVLLNRFGVNRVGPYVVVGIVLWACVLKSGVHATLAGVVTAWAIPLEPDADEGCSLLERLEHALHPWVAFGVLPAFAFANAGISFAGINIESFVEPVMLGISLGLFVGKQLGVFATLFLVIKFGLAPMPEGTNWCQLYAVSLFCGIGFTMSLFVGSLAFEHAHFDAPIRLGVMTGSFLSAIFGYTLLKVSLPATAMNGKTN